VAPQVIVVTPDRLGYLKSTRWPSSPLGSDSGRQGIGWLNNSCIVQRWSASPAAIAVFGPST